jgi:hypothetical protein
MNQTIRYLFHEGRDSESRRSYTPFESSIPAAPDGCGDSGDSLLSQTTSRSTPFEAACVSVSLNPRWVRIHPSVLVAKDAQGMLHRLRGLGLQQSKTTVR